ncbi:hypothetical protein CTEN210_09952 [Chaetoceros tenuissimus]|uniref:PIH1 N-terminal domain-containing protein n=1 Tax=Chaetoceros tenuissimus TaxID=426638 RepID=A0AAD3H7V7_9STRA|nr:hypothetical protein CTEN210_09952 [Chaetoceros tenuissimus]
MMDLKQIQDSKQSRDKDDFVKLFMPGESKDEGVLIQPKEGFVIKTKESKNQQKVFINVTFHEAIAKPSVKKRLDKDGKEIEGLNLPLSMSAIRECTDRSGNPCLVVDAVSNPCKESEISADSTGSHLDFLCQALLQCFDQKHKDYAPLDRKYVLPKLKYIGFVNEVTGEVVRKQSEEVGVLKQFVKDTSKSELTLKEYLEHAKAIENEVLCMNLGESRSMPFIILDSKNIQGLRVFFLMSEADASLIEIKASAYSLFLSKEGYKTLEYPLPVSINTKSIRCEYNRETEVVTIQMTLDEACQHENPDVGTDQWTMSKALSTSSKDNKNSQTFNDDDPSSSSESNIVNNDFDPFHIHSKLPWKQIINPAKKTEAKGDFNLPEDKYHTMDTISQYNLQEQEKERLEKSHERKDFMREGLSEKEEQCEMVSSIKENEKQCFTDSKHKRCLDSIEKLLKRTVKVNPNTPSAWYTVV